MQISQIYISDKKTELSPYLRGCVETVKAYFPQLPHVLYDEDTLRQFLMDRFDSEVVAAYDKLNPYSYKADLGRYCLLYALGGWYFDIAVRIFTRISIPENIETLAFRDFPFSGTSWSVSAGIIYSKSENPVLQTAIRKVVQNCRNEYYGLNALCPTGPVVLGEAFAAHEASANRIFGDLQFLTPNHTNKNPAFVLPSGAILAFAKPDSGIQGGNLNIYGATGTNDYNEIYRSRKVYKTQSSQ